MLIGTSSINGSPGVSAWTLLIAAAWPGDSLRVLVEADASGGVLAARYGVSADPGVVSLVSQARLHPGRRPELESCGRRLDDSLWCVPGPETAEGAGHIWATGGEPLAECLTGDDRLWFLDCGRVYPNSALNPLLAACDIHLLFTGSSTESLIPVPSRVSWLAHHAPTCVISVGNSGRHPDEMLSFFGSERVWQVAYQRELAKIAGQIFDSGRARRSKAWRTAVDISDNIAGWMVQSRELTSAQNSALMPTDPVPGRASTESSREAAASSGKPGMPSDEFRNPSLQPNLPPDNAKLDWYEPLAGLPIQKMDRAQDTRASEAG